MLKKFLEMWRTFGLSFRSIYVKGGIPVEDREIVALYWQRDERAVEETERQYGSYCRSISYGILRNRQDSEECVNDTWLRAWHAMPPQRPRILSAFLGKITRNLSLQAYERRQAQKRGGGQVLLALEELESCLEDGPELQLEAAELGRLLDQFVRSLPLKDGCVFIRRYWFLDPLEDIAAQYRMALGSVKSSLYRSRGKLRVFLEEKGVQL